MSSPTSANCRIHSQVVLCSLIVSNASFARVTSNLRFRSFVSITFDSDAWAGPPGLRWRFDRVIDICTWSWTRDGRPRRIDNGTHSSVGQNLGPPYPASLPPIFCRHGGRIPEHVYRNHLCERIYCLPYCAKLVGTSNEPAPELVVYHGALLKSKNSRRI